MKKLYLTASIPDKGTGLEHYKSGDWPEDIKLKIRSHEEEKKQMSNIPPNIKMLPLAKYHTVKWAKTLEKMPDMDTMSKKKKSTEVKTDKEKLIDDAIKRLPGYARDKAESLAQVLVDHYEDGDTLYSLLFDLTTRGRKVKSDPDDLREAIVHLEGDEDIKDGSFINKLKRKEEIKQERKKRETLPASHPTNWTE